MSSIHPIFIADGNELLLDGLISILSHEPGLRIIGTARNSRELAEKSLRCSPDIFLLDYDLFYQNETQLSKHVMNLRMKARIIMLTDHWEKSLIKRMKAAGVMGCLRKTCDANELVFAIYHVLSGKTYFSEFSVDHPGQNEC